MAKGRRASDHEMLYDAFHMIRELGRGGQGRVLEVRADRNAAGFHDFLASAIAWQEVTNHKQIVPMRLAIQGLNREIQQWIEKEADFMDAGDERSADQAHTAIEGLMDDLRRQVDDLKAKQEAYISQRHSHLNEAGPEAMIKHIRKLGLPYPEDDVFAMKQILIDDVKARTRLQDEFKSIKLVQHENIVKVYAAGEDYYITEFIRGMVPREQVESHSQSKDEAFTNEDRINIIIDAARAIEHAHVFGVVHRDIKPENIAVDRDRKVTLIDFGLAKSVETENLTATGVAIGTPYFMSREQIETTKEASPTFDIYALGASLYTYITGERPYERARNKYSGKEKETDSAQDVFLTVCNMAFEPIPPTEIADGIPKVLQDIILKAMAKEKKLRYQSVREFREDLEQYLHLADGDTLQSGSFFGIDSKQIDMRVRRRDYRSSHDREHKGGLGTAHKIAIGIFAAAALVLLVWLGISAGADGGSRKQSHGEELAAQEARLQGMVEYAEQYSSEHPEEYENAIDKFRTLVHEARGTKYQMMAEDRIREIEQARDKACGAIIKNLAVQAAALTKAEQFKQAQQVYLDYEGPLADRTLSERQGRAAEIRKRAKDAKDKIRAAEEQARRDREADRRKTQAAEAARQKELAAKQAKIRTEELPLLARQVLDGLKTEQLAETKALIETKSEAPAYAVILKELRIMRDAVMAAQKFQADVLAYFESRTGKDVQLAIEGSRSGEKGTVKEFKNRTITLQKTFMIDGTTGYSELKVPLAKIRLTQLVSLAKTDTGNIHAALAVYLAAERRGDTSVKASLEDKVKNHLLLELTAAPEEELPAATAAGSEPDPAAEPAAGNLLDGGGFERAGPRGFEGWAKTEYWSRNVLRDTEVKHSGAASVRIAGVAKLSGRRARLHPEDLTLKPETEYRIVFWLKTADLKASQAGPVIVDGPRSYLLHENFKFKASQDWTRYEHVFKTGKQVRVSLTLGLWSVSSGTAWFDDLALYEVEAEPEGANWIALFDNDPKILKHNGARFTLKDGELHLTNYGTYPVGITMPMDKTVELEFEIRAAKDNNPKMYLRGVQHNGTIPNVSVILHKDGDLEVMSRGGAEAKSVMGRFNQGRDQRVPGTGWQKFSYIIGPNYLKARWGDLVFYEGELPEGDWPYQVGFQAQGYVDEVWVEVRKARWREVEGGIPAPEKPQMDEINLLEGDSLKAAGWYESPSPDRTGTVAWDDGMMVLAGPGKTAIHKNMNMRPGILRLTYELDGSYASLRLGAGDRYLLIEIKGDAKGRHELEMDFKGDSVEVLLDGKTPASGNTIAIVPIEMRDGKLGPVDSLNQPLQGKGVLRFSLPRDNRMLRVRNFNFQPLAAWDNLMTESRWEAMGGAGSKFDHYRWQDNSVIIEGPVLSTPQVSVDVGPMELEFDFDYVGSYWDFKIHTDACLLMVPFTRADRGPHHVRFIADDRGARLFFDGKEVELNSTKSHPQAALSYHSGGRWRPVPKGVQPPFKGKGLLRFYYSKSAEILTISNLRFRSLK